MKPLEPLRPQRRAPDPPAHAVDAPAAADESLELHLPPIATLPRDHPAWHHDLPIFTERGRMLLAALEPLIIRVIGFWDHAVRRLTFGDRRLSIDVSGSYRLE